MKRQLAKWGKILVNHIADWDQTPNYTEKLYNSTVKNKKNPIKNQAEDLNRQLSKEDTQMANRYMNRYSTSLSIREMHIKTTARHHFTHVSVAIIKKIRNVTCWRGRGEGSPVRCWRDCKLVQPP